jgi:hypothetical protein
VDVHIHGIATKGASDGAFGFVRVVMLFFSLPYGEKVAEALSPYSDAGSDEGQADESNAPIRNFSQPG